MFLAIKVNSRAFISFAWAAVYFRLEIRERNGYRNT